MPWVNIPRDFEVATLNKNAPSESYGDDLSIVRGDIRIDLLPTSLDKRLSSQINQNPTNENFDFMAG